MHRRLMVTLEILPTCALTPLLTYDGRAVRKKCVSLILGTRPYPWFTPQVDTRKVGSSGSRKGLVLLHRVHFQEFNSEFGPQRRRIWFWERNRAWGKIRAHFCAERKEPRIFVYVTWQPALRSRVWEHTSLSSLTRFLLPSVGDSSGIINLDCTLESPETPLDM